MYIAPEIKNKTIFSYIFGDYILDYTEATSSTRS